MTGWDQLLTTLVVERGDALKRYAFLLCGDDGAAEDLVQDALVRALGRPFAARDPIETESYLRRIIVNLSIDRHRSVARWRRFVPLLAVRQDGPDPGAEVAVAHDLRSALGLLSPRQRACVVLRFYEDQPVAGVAAALGCSEGTVKRHLSDAMTRLAAFIGAPTPHQPPREDSTWPSTQT